MTDATRHQFGKPVLLVDARVLLGKPASKINDEGRDNWPIMLLNNRTYDHSKLVAFLDEAREHFNVLLACLTSEERTGVSYLMNKANKGVGYGFDTDTTKTWSSFPGEAAVVLSNDSLISKRGKLTQAAKKPTILDSSAYKGEETFKEWYSSYLLNRETQDKEQDVTNAEGESTKKHPPVLQITTKPPSNLYLATSDGFTLEERDLLTAIFNTGLVKKLLEQLPAKKQEISSSIRRHAINAFRSDDPRGLIKEMKDELTGLLDPSSQVKGPSRPLRHLRLEGATTPVSNASNIVSHHINKHRHNG